MNCNELTEKIVSIKLERDWTWKYIAKEIGGMSEVLVVGALLGQMKLTKPQCAKAQSLFGLYGTRSATAQSNTHARNANAANRSADLSFL